MSHPPKGTSLAPRARWAASRGEVRSVTPPNLPGDRRPLGQPVDLVATRTDLVDRGVDVGHHPAEGQEVQHALALVLVDDVDQVFAVADEDHAVAGDDELGRREV